VIKFTKYAFKIPEQEYPKNNKIIFSSSAIKEKWEKMKPI
jgi:hypothetical protein